MAASESMTPDEIGRLGKALESQEFRDLLLDYAREVSDPASRALYESEVRAVEKERGFDVTFVRPEPRYVLKTTIQGSPDGRKSFINVCQHEAIEKPSCRRVSPEVAQSFNCEERGLLWTVPHNVTPPRDEPDRVRGRTCTVYDCVYHPDTIRLANSNRRFKEMIEEVAMDAVENNFDVKLNRLIVKYPKIKFKGTPTVTLLRKKIAGFQPSVDSDVIRPHSDSVPASSLSDCVADDKVSDVGTVEVPDVEMSFGSACQESPVELRHSIKHRYRHDMQDYACTLSGSPVRPPERPSELVVEIQMPEAVNGCADVELDVKTDRLTCRTVVGRPHLLELRLPHLVDDTRGNAKYDIARRMLVVELPVVAEADVTTVENGIASVEEGMISGDDGVISNETAEGDDECKERDSVGDVADQLSALDIGTVPTQPDTVRYTLPSFSCHQSNDELVLVVKARNIVERSVRFVYTDEGRRCRIYFDSVGQGGFPLHHSLGLRLEVTCRLSQGAESRTVGEDNAVVILSKHEDSRYHWDCFFYGVDPDCTDNVEVLTINPLQRKMDILQNEMLSSQTEIQSYVDNAPPVKIVDVTSECLKIEIQSGNQDSDGEAHSQEETDTDRDDECADTVKSNKCEANASRKYGETNGHVNKNGVGDDDNITRSQPINVNGTTADMKRRGFNFRKARSVSESGDDSSPTQHYRGILRYTRQWRTMSESSDDFSWSSQEFTIDPDIPEDECVDGTSKVKKVHFNSVVHRNIFRSNSSILGQRMKNQRKQRKKREAAMKRSSESECSEGESEKSKSSNGDVTRRQSPDSVNGNNSPSNTKARDDNFQQRTARKASPPPPAVIPAAGKAAARQQTSKQQFDDNRTNGNHQHLTDSGVESSDVDNRTSAASTSGGKKGKTDANNGQKKKNRGAKKNRNSPAPEDDCRSPVNANAPTGNLNGSCKNKAKFDFAPRSRTISV